MKAPFYRQIKYFRDIKQSMQQFYLHNQYINNGTRKNAKPIKMHGKHLLCMTNDNTLELYQYTANGIRYYSKHSFNCNIQRIEILPTKEYSNNDYIFIVDKQGRYAFWQSEGEFQMVQNTRIESRDELYQSDETQQVRFSGSIHHFDVFDTRGSIFFSIHHTMVLIDYSITRMGLTIDKVKKIQIPYVQYRHIGWVQDKKDKLLGIIEENEEKTVLNIHNVNGFKLAPQTLVYKFEKNNIQEFLSDHQSIQVISDDQITTLSHGKTYQTLFNYKVHHAAFGKVVRLPDEIYCFVGEDFVVLRDGKFKTYGPLCHEGTNIFEGKGILQANFLLKTQDQGHIICITTLNNEIYFIILYQDTWKLYYHLKALTSIYSIHPTPNPNSMLVVMDQSIESYQLVLVERQNGVRLIKQQNCESTVDRIICVDKGKYIIVCTALSNQLMEYNEVQGDFHSILHLPLQNVLALSNNFLITDQALYAFSPQNRYMQQLSRQDIILSCANQSLVYYMNANGIIKAINLSSNDIKIVRQHAQDEYIWHILPDNDMIAAKASNLLALYIYRQNQILTEIPLQQNCLISSLYHYSFENDFMIEGLIVVGYTNGHIHLHTFDGKIKGKFDQYCHEPVTLFPINDCLLGVMSGAKQFILAMKDNKLTLNPISFTANGNLTNSVVFLQMSSKFIFVQNDTMQSSKLIRTISLGDVYNCMNKSVNSHDSYTLQPICAHLKDIPIVYLHSNHILVGVSGEFQVYQLQSGKMIISRKNYLKDVLGIFILECGIIVYGVDQIQRNLVYIYSLSDYEELCFTNFITKDNKYFKTLKGIPQSNRFLCRGQTFTSLCELSGSEIIQVKQFKTDLPGYSLQIDNAHKLMVQTDNNRLFLVFTYDNTILPIARYVNQCQINDIAIFHRCVLIGDKGGSISVLEFNTQNQNQVFKMSLTKVASVKVGEEITTLCVSTTQGQAYYGTVSGQIGLVKIISQEDYIKLKPVQQQMVKELNVKCDFQYKSWRQRNSSQDKLIDSVLIKRFIRQNHNRTLRQQQRQTLEQTSKIYTALAH